MAMMTLVGVMNRPQRDEQMVAAAGINLDRALFPLLVSVGRLGPIGVGEVADRVGRDYTTVSRQMAKLESLGLIRRQPGEKDRRVTEATATEAGMAMNAAIDAARGKMARRIFDQWDDADIETLTRLMSRFARELEAQD
jgi:DNA-binding MarR family transcriptional regulator